MTVRVRRVIGGVLAVTADRRRAGVLGSGASDDINGGRGDGSLGARTPS